MQKRFSKTSKHAWRITSLFFIAFFFRGQRTRPTIVLTPAGVESIDRGWLHQRPKVKQHFYENAKCWLSRLSGMIVNRFYKGI